MNKPGSTASVIQGQLGVHRVVAELIKHGHIPYLPVIDVGVDILLGSGVRLQVKSTRRPLATRNSRLAGAWSFTLSKAQRIVQREYLSCSSRKFSDEVDFVVLHAIEAKRFWVVPAAVLDNRYTVLFKDGRKQYKDCDVDKAKALRAQGLSFQAIADELGTSHHTVMRRIKGIGSWANRNYADIPQYEDRWDLIAAVVATKQTVADAVSQSAGAGVEPSLISEA